MAADDAVVADLAEIIDLGSLADHGVANAAAIDPRAGADLDIVMDDDAADLRNLGMALGAEQIAEAVLADIASGMDDDAVADMAWVTEQLAPIAQSLPIRTSGPITAWAPIRVPAPMLADGPITANGSTVTPSPSCAVGCTIAPGETPTVPNIDAGRSAPL